jgi:hypothetical protein
MYLSLMPTIILSTDQSFLFCEDLGLELVRCVEGLYCTVYIEYQSVCPFVVIGSPRPMD